jgi:hypothetical protein
LLNYGVGEGEADSLAEGDASAAAFLVLFLAAGEADASAEVALVFLVDDFAVVFLVVDVPCVVAVEEAAIGSSFFAHELRNATVASAVIKVTRDVFISLVN